MQGASQVALVVKNLHANTVDARDESSIPRLGRSPGGGNDNPLQCSCLENPMDRGAWRATVHRVAKSLTQLKRLSTQACILIPMGWGMCGDSASGKTCPSTSNAYTELQRFHFMKKSMYVTHLCWPSIPLALAKSKESVN